ncbi:prolactin receptor isoform X1 [Python bivittatus]|uniref:Prolactin receptor n=2 Tax=Python bivittatus TaxID=176946 RepID=A0A9F2NI58_PYTBI|nr:prolactin receptor isoform X1 [Python bivittatus]
MNSNFFLEVKEDTGMKLRQSVLDAFILLPYLSIWIVDGQSPPGKPKIISCLSQGNETFTCQWEPNSDGGLPTNYTLLYNTIGEEETHECPDYLSAGPNSCYFNQRVIRLWQTYNISVKATNDAGSNMSDPHYVDVKEMVKPNSPMNLSLEVKMMNGTMYVWSKWSPPPWVNDSALCNYELRLKSAEGKEWENYFVGEHMQHKISQWHPGIKYTAQVRCITKHGKRSAWSPESYIHLRSGLPPGKPVFIGCRSPEKETFTCWWKPSSEGSLPRNYTLLYNRERDKKYYECPDYTTAGPNSCYFDKKHTSLWMTYNFTLKAMNEMGSSVADPYYVDVANIVQPNPPENLSLAFEKKVYGEYLLLNWNPPSLGDVKSGWLTLEYELRIKPEEGQEWEKIFVGQRTTYKMFSVNPGERYVAQVRCRSDHGNWSIWSLKSYIKLQKGISLKDVVVWIFVVFLSIATCLILIWILALKRTKMVARLLPPVPGPKIKGFDAQLLQAGKTEELLSALDCQGFPPTSDYEDLLIEFLEIDDSEDQQLMPNHGKSHLNKTVKPAHQETDCDSGRGSSESPSLLQEKYKEARKHPSEVKVLDPDEVQRNTDTKKLSEILKLDSERHLSWLTSGSPKAYMWPRDQPGNPHSPKCSSHDTVEICKMALKGTNVKRSPILGRSERKHCSQPPESIETISKEKTAQLEDGANLSLSTQFNQEVFWLAPPRQSPFTSTKPMDYVEIHKVSNDGVLAVLPKQKESVDKTEKGPVPTDAKEYSKVSTVVANHILVLLPESRIEALPSFQELPEESNQQSQAEKNMVYCLPVPNMCKIQTGGLDYMDPNNLMAAFH